MTNEITGQQMTMEIDSPDFEAITLRVEAGYRGGGIEIDLTAFGWSGVTMTAYQNYLGGGMLGAIGNSCNLSGWEGNEQLSTIADNLARYFHSLTNHEGDEWEEATFEQNQLRPKSGY